MDGEKAYAVVLRDVRTGSRRLKAVKARSRASAEEKARREKSPAEMVETVY